MDLNFNTPPLTRGLGGDSEGTITFKFQYSPSHEGAPAAYGDQIPD